MTQYKKRETTLSVPMTPRYLPWAVLAMALVALRGVLRGLSAMEANELAEKGVALPQPASRVGLRRAATTQFEQRRYVVFGGTRPEIIKIAPVVSALKAARLNTHVVFTGQHPDLSLPFQKFWKIEFDTSLEKVFQANNTLPNLIATMISAIDHAIPIQDADVWIVQGDTATSLAAGMVAFYRRTPLIHLEAGLRTFDHASPFPEEVNRRTLSLMASIQVAPTKMSQGNLIAQGVEADRIQIMGNTGIDAARLAETALTPPAFLDDSLKGQRLVLVTLHRRENAPKFAAYFAAIGGMHLDNVAFVVPVHPNPDASAAAKGACAKWPHVRCVSPLGYGETQWMLKHAILLMTDSGGLQEEATWYGRATLVLRETTERSEAIDAGSSVLVPDPDTLATLLVELLERHSTRLAEMSKRSLAFGDGHTAERFVNFLQTPRSIELLQRPIRMAKPLTLAEPKRPLHYNAVLHRNFDSNAFWERRYAGGGDSGSGSYGAMATYKAAVINDLVARLDIQTVGEFGCGDGANLKLYTAIPSYVGYDVSNTAVRQNQRTWAGNASRTFRHYNGTLTPPFPTFSLTLSLDVLYHLVDYTVWATYLDQLFRTSSAYVLIYAVDKDVDHQEHVLFRKFTPYIAEHFPCWELGSKLRAPPPTVRQMTEARFTLFQRRPACVPQRMSEDNAGLHRNFVAPQIKPQDALPLCSAAASWEVCEPDTPTIDVVLTVWKRPSLAQQLNDVAAQSMVPTHVWIIQNENHVAITPIVDQWRQNHPEIPIDVVASSANTQFHGRFFLAYLLSSAFYVSIWDDDVTASEDWLKYCVQFSKTHKDALVGGNGRTIASIGTRAGNALTRHRKKTTQHDATGQGRVDFVGHSWTLRRTHLSFFLGTPPKTLATGEDIQLSHALQQQGIDSWSPPHTPTASLRDTRFSSGAHASYVHQDQSPREWLICRSLLDGFKPIKCSNCEEATLTACTQRFREVG